MGSNDPRTSSTQSLVPVPESEHAGRRTLLLVYVHGFMGNETSFQSFPAHVHNLVTVTLADTHVVHTKIYPKYKSRRAIEFARDDFSTWLAPHESPTTDVILLGHSMGGLLCSEVALVPPYSTATGDALRHRLIGTINFDVPFLGMHPGVVVSGLGSIFRPADSPAQPTGNESSSRSASNVNRVNTFFSPKPSDPNYNPVFPNDVNLPERSGWGNALHFISKHSDGLMNATKSYVTSHLEFGGTMADYGSLKKRYARIRALEEEDEAVRQTAISSTRPPPRVRFINYYTASTGRPKKPKSPSSSRPSSRSSSKQGEEGEERPVEAEMEEMHLTPTTTKKTQPSRSPSVNSFKSAEEHRDNAVRAKELEEPRSATSEHDEEMDMRHIDSMPIDDDEHEHIIVESTADLSLVTRQQTTDSSANPLSLEDTAITSPSSTMSLSSTITLPPIPPVPDEPPSVDFSQYTDKDTRKLAEKEHARVLKNYKQTVKDRNAAIKDRAQFEEKIEKNRRKQAEKAAKAAEKEAEKAKKLAEKKAADREKETQEPEKEKEEEFSWEKVWAADRARETRQRDYERLMREGKTEEAEALLNEGKKPQEKLPQEEPPPSKPLTRQSTKEPLTRQSTTHEPLTQQSTLEPTTPSASSGTYHHSTTNILNTDTPSARTEAAAAKAAESKKKENPKAAAAKPKRDKKFCMLPPTDAHGRLDPTWFRVYMEGVDEVGAHCGLFFVSETYERLVGDVGARIEEWVREDMTERLVRELGGAGAGQGE
ncbi:uncharacterized protein BDZ99DRAFT_505303 [Mytilinidion resinicola]|uniref:DUF676 domain-containing protein n=1 Tax=Mytilinidion resinicola TaxID=574789 RepID=A0A6A6Z981_9PEZI|nr:uncharacterized protein BDZ99DRAFT_505303 [Mytilinidion resinicola]KAF2817682.1 hypothetical protein BDZ99DRAFT_505303 [Mytilinidion resinicola]